MAVRKSFVGSWLILAAIAGAWPAKAAVMTVTNLTDVDEDGDGCSLREAIQNANGDDSSGSTDCVAGGGVDTIHFSLDGTITQTAQLNVTDADELTIDGSGRSVVLAGVFPTVRNLAVTTGAALRLKGVTLTAGTATMGGCVHVAGGAALATEEVLFTGCNANFGAAIYLLGTLSAVDTWFQDNNGFIQAGAIAHSGTVATVNRCTFSGNTGPADGGAIVVQGGPSVLNVQSSTFSANRADAAGGNGGAIYLVIGTVAITNSTFSGNISADAGSALYVSGGTMSITDSIVANGVTGVNCGGAITDGGGNLTWPGSDTSCPGILSDPKLFPLYDNGGFTPTFELQTGSAAYDSAANVFCPAIDQRGRTRPQGADCDIGAVEGRGVQGYVFFDGFESQDTSNWSATVTPP